MRRVNRKEINKRGSQLNGITMENSVVLVNLKTYDNSIVFL